MAITVKLYSFTKRENSTKRPSSGGTDYSCTLIDNTSLMNPTFKIESASNPIGKNYCYVSDFHRYYFVDDISSYQGFWYISCHCDVLATYKTEIGTQSHYVLRSASSYDGDISDSVYPAKTAMTGYIDHADNNDDPLAWSNGHCYVLGIVGSTDVVLEQFGSLNFYVMNDAALSKFLLYLMNNIDSWGNIATSEYSVGVQQALINPIQYIKSCICMPFSADSVTGYSAATIKFGYYSYTTPSGSTYVVKKVSDYSVVKSKEVALLNLRTHPQAATRGDYLNCQPFTSYTLHFGPWGDIDLDPLLLKGNTKVRVETLYDLIGGVGRLIVSGNVITSKVLFNGSAKVGVDINLSQVYKDALGYESATTRTLFGAISAGASITNPIADVASGLSFITSGVQDMTRLNYPTVSGVGSSGSYLAFHDPDNLYLLSRFIEIVDENLDEIGRPLCQTKQINTLSGYILCDKADAQISGTADEAVKVNEYLNTGFFYE